MYTRMHAHMHSHTGLPPSCYFWEFSRFCFFKAKSHYVALVILEPQYGDQTGLKLLEKVVLPLAPEWEG